MTRYPRSLLTDETVLEIKSKLWEGELMQAEIAERHHTTQATISRIMHGYMYPHVKWPDGSDGGMSIEHWKMVIGDKRRRNAERSRHVRKAVAKRNVSKTAEAVAEALKDGEDKVGRAVRK